MAKKKMKVRKSLTKRFKVTKTGKVLHRKGFRRHLSVKKSASRKRQGRRMKEAPKSFSKRIRKAIGFRRSV